MNRLLILTAIPALLVGACGYQPAPKPPGYDSVTETQADGIPPILSQEQLDALDKDALATRIKQLQTTRRNTHDNPGVANVLDSQLEAAQARMDLIESAD